MAAIGTLRSRWARPRHAAACEFRVLRRWPKPYTLKARKSEDTHEAPNHGLSGLAVLFVSIGSEAAYARSKSFKIVVPYTPGSGPDITSRLMSEHISRAHGVNMVVENRPGAGTVIGTEAAARAAPDGNTVVMVANSFVINPAVGRGNYTVQGSFEPVCQLAATPWCWWCRARRR